MRPLGLLLTLLGCAWTADRAVIVQDPAVSKAIKEKYVAIACNLIKGRLTDRYGATGVQPLAQNTVVLFHVGAAGEQFGRVRSHYSSIGYERGYLPIVTAAYEVDGVRYRETAFADQPKS